MCLWNGICQSYLSSQWLIWCRYGKNWFIFSNRMIYRSTGSKKSFAISENKTLAETIHYIPKVLRKGNLMWLRELLKAPQKCLQIAAVYKMPDQHGWHSLWNGLNSTSPSNQNWTLGIGISSFQFGAELLLHGVWQEHLVETKALLGCP